MRPSDLKLDSIVPPAESPFSFTNLDGNQNRSPGSPLSRTAQQAAWRMWEECTSEGGIAFIIISRLVSRNGKGPFQPPPQRSESGIWQSVSDESNMKTKRNTNQAHNADSAGLTSSEAGGVENGSRDERINGSNEHVVSQSLSKVEKETVASAARGTGRKSTPVKAASDGNSQKKPSEAVSPGPRATLPLVPFDPRMRKSLLTKPKTRQEEKQQQAML